MAALTAATIFVLGRKMVLRLGGEAMCKSSIAGTVMAIIVLTMQQLSHNNFLPTFYALVGAAIHIVTLLVLRVAREPDIEFIRKYLGQRPVLASDLIERILI